MKFSALFTILPVLALAAPTLASPVAKKRACVRPSASASASASASVDASASAVPTSSVNTDIFAPEPTASASASLEEPASSVEPSVSASATASAEPTASASASASASEAESEAPSSTSSAEPAESSAPATDESDADLFVRLHNDFRAQYGAPAVEWDEELAQFARDYAPICQMQHSSGPYGENLAGGAGGGYNIERAFNSWANEGQYYDWNQPGTLEATVDGQQMGLGHFTQVVWKATTKIGCAAVTCGDGTLFTGYGDSLFVVCEYSPAGNVYMSGGDPNALFVENVGEKI